MTAPEVPWHIRVQRVLLRAIGLLIIRTAYRSRTANVDFLPEKGGALLLPNHVTFADAFFISAACPRPVRFVMDDAVLKYPPVRWFCSIFNTVNIRRGQSREALRLTIEAIEQGDVVCFFAEGQLTRTGALNELKRGVELISAKITAPLVPLWIDGAWGSVFSFERNRFFRKKPHKLPHDQFAAFGPPLSPDNATTESIRDSVLRAAADAIRLRFSESATPAEINGYQIGQLNALPWRKPFAFLSSDPLPSSLLSLFDGFSQQFGSLPISHPHISGPIPNWVGGKTTREALSSSPPSSPVDFYDFSENALEPLLVENVRHFPCLAIGGLVVAMSIPDPAVPKRATFQAGSKPDTWGLLLPGWFIEDNKLKGPASSQGILLPPGASADAQGFLHPEQPSAQSIQSV